MLNRKEFSKLQLRKTKLDSLTLEKRLYYKKSDNSIFDLKLEEVEKSIAEEIILGIKKGSAEEKLNIISIMINNENQDVQVYALLKLVEFTDIKEQAIMNDNIFTTVKDFVLRTKNAQIKVIYFFNLHSFKVLISSSIMQLGRRRSIFRQTP